MTDSRCLGRVIAWRSVPPRQRRPSKATSSEELLPIHEGKPHKIPTSEVRWSYPGPLKTLNKLPTASHEQHRSPSFMPEIPCLERRSEVSDACGKSGKMGRKHDGLRIREDRCRVESGDCRWRPRGLLRGN